MIKPELFDAIELLVDLPEVNIKAGEIGTIVEKYDDRALLSEDRQKQVLNFTRSLYKTSA